MVHKQCPDCSYYNPEASKTYKCCVPGYCPVAIPVTNTHLTSLSAELVGLAKKLPRVPDVVWQLNEIIRVATIEKEKLS